MDVLLINPRVVGTPRLRWSGEHLGLAYMAASLRAEGFSVSIIDADLCNINEEELLLAVQERQPSLIGISVTDETHQDVLRFSKYSKEIAPSSKICIGGHGASFLYKDDLFNHNIDYVCIGEGEITLVRLAQHLSGKIGVNGIPGLAYRDSNRICCQDPSPVDLNMLAFPARDTTSYAIEYGCSVLVSSSRGCYGSCNFCSIRKFYNYNYMSRWRGIHPERVVRELIRLVGRYNVNEFVFVDDNFIGPPKVGPKRANQIAKNLIDTNLNIKFTLNCRADDVKIELFEHLKAAGLTRVFIGIESFSNDVLIKINKKTTFEINVNAIQILNQIGIDISPSLILFTPWTDLDCLEKTFDIMERNLTEYNISNLFSHLWYLKGTKYQDNTCNQLRASHIHDKKVAILFGHMSGVADNILKVNECLGRVRYAHGVTYNKFEREVKGAFSISLEVLRTYSSHETINEKLEYIWGEIGKKYNLCKNEENVITEGDFNEQKVATYRV